MTTMAFDDSLPTLVKTLRTRKGDPFVETGVILRDASGRLTFFSDQAEVTDAERETLAKALIDALGPYARPDRSIVFADDPGAKSLLTSGLRVPIQIEGVFCQLLDRRIVGAGWLDAPAAPSAGPPRIVFATLKGGVGRSTALAVAAADLARRDHNVLVVDLDLEAPGVGDMILNDDRLPSFGSVDFLVEDGLGGVADADLGQFTNTSGLTAAGGGRVDVLPALGTRSRRSPENILAKLSRAMIEDVTDTGSISVARQISTMIDRVAAAGEYDVVLIDSRAGLSELAAPAVIGLGATVLLFGTAQRQTIEGYRALFAGLQLLAQRDRALGGDADWRAALRPVYAKSSQDPKVGAQFLDDLYELYSAHLYDEEAAPEQSDELLRYVRDDPAAPHWPLVIPFNPTFVDFDPSRNPGQLTPPFYEQTYRSFLQELDAIIAAATRDGVP